MQKTALVFRVRQSRAQKYVWWATVTPVVVVEAEELGASCPTFSGCESNWDSVVPGCWSSFLSLLHSHWHWHSLVTLRHGLGHGTSKMTNTIMMTPPSSRAAAIRALMTILHFCLFFKDTSVSCDKGLEKPPVLVVFSSLLLGVVEVVVLGAVSDEADLLFAG